LVEGIATITWENGDKYTGEWENNKRNGYGTFTSFDGKIKKGIWKDNKYVGK
jgi:hypothetical protein